MDHAIRIRNNYLSYGGLASRICVSLAYYIIILAGNKVCINISIVIWVNVSAFIYPQRHMYEYTALQEYEYYASFLPFHVDLTLCI
jgi:hypothetical protein